MIGNNILKVKDIILDILFPKVCINCKREGKYICDKCSIFISEAEPMIYTGECLDGLISVWDYEGLVKELIQMIKYQGITDVIKELIFLIDIKVYCPYITYIPMYIKKEKKRGFNQAELIAKELGKISNSKVVSLLKKIIDTKDQARLERERGLENVKRSFVESRPLKNLIKATRGQASVLLVDDVFTTGATMRECCKVLKKAGINKVWGFTLARTA